MSDEQDTCPLCGRDQSLMACNDPHLRQTYTCRIAQLERMCDQLIAECLRVMEQVGDYVDFDQCPELRDELAALRSRFERLKQ